MDRQRLSVIRLFAGVPDDDLAAVAAVANEAEVAEGDVIVAEGDFGHAVFAIETGTAEVRVEGAVRTTLGPGDVFGEIAVLASGRRTATVVATSPMRLISWFKPDVWRLERSAPEAARRLQDLLRGDAAA